MPPDSGVRRPPDAETMDFPDPKSQRTSDREASELSPRGGRARGRLWLQYCTYCTFISTNHQFVCMYDIIVIVYPTKNKLPHS